jgi:hypothetical protein
LWSFGIFYGHLLLLWSFGRFFSVLVYVLYQEKPWQPWYFWCHLVYFSPFGYMYMYMYWTKKNIRNPGWYRHFISNQTRPSWDSIPWPGHLVLWGHCYVHTITISGDYILKLVSWIFCQISCTNLSSNISSFCNFGKNIFKCLTLVLKEVKKEEKWPEMFPWNSF